MTDEVLKSKERTLEEAYNCGCGIDSSGLDLFFLDRRQVLDIIWYMGDSLMILNPDAVISFVNKTTEEMLGYNVCEIIGKPVGLVVDDKDMKLFLFLKDIVAQGSIRNYDMNYLSKKGEKIQVAVNASIMRDAQKKLAGIIIAARDMRQTIETIHNLEETKATLEDRVRRRTVALEKTYKELKDAQTHLVQREKMASIGQLAAGVAHEINNPMGFVNSNLNTLTSYVIGIKEILSMYRWLEESVKNKDYEKAGTILQDIDGFKQDIDFEFTIEDMDKLVSESNDGVERVREIVRGLREFSHSGESKMVEFNVNEGLESTIKMVWNELKYKADITKEYGDVHKIWCFPNQINQVFTNILVNAAHAIPTKGEIKIKTYAEGFMTTNNGWVVIEILDTGAGMSEDVKTKIFDPFFTTKPVGMGTGLGLAIAYSIIEKHGGTIDVESEADKGTKFIIRLPFGEVNHA
ncbi:MAG: PAS domain-containing protein [Deltaproteobacteria bacterium]|nr:PAS domain-containing protein [Deltaproteobacteria bacterium]